MVACHIMVDGFCCIQGLGLTRVSDVCLQLGNQPLNYTGRLADVSCEIYRSTKMQAFLSRDAIRAVYEQERLILFCRM